MRRTSVINFIEFFFSSMSFIFPILIFLFINTTNAMVIPDVVSKSNVISVLDFREYESIKGSYKDIDITILTSSDEYKIVPREMINLDEIFITRVGEFNVLTASEELRFHKYDEDILNDQKALTNAYLTNIANVNGRVKDEFIKILIRNLILFGIAFTIFIAACNRVIARRKREEEGEISEPLLEP